MTLFLLALPFMSVPYQMQEFWPLVPYRDGQCEQHRVCALRVRKREFEIVTTVVKTVELLFPTNEKMFIRKPL